MIANSGVVDLCLEDPGHDVDVYISADLEYLVGLWMGNVDLGEAVDARTVFIDGSRHLINSAPDWMSRSPFVGVPPADVKQMPG